MTRSMKSESERVSGGRGRAGRVGDEVPHFGGCKKQDELGSGQRASIGLQNPAPQEP